MSSVIDQVFSLIHTQCQGSGRLELMKGRKSPKITRNIRAPRSLSEPERSFLDELELYDRVIETTKLISVNQHGIQTDGRGLRAVRIFTRQTVVGLSLQQILPRPSSLTHRQQELWDVCSVASLSRTLIEGYLALYYFGLEKVSDEESELRFFIAQLHRNVEWYEIRKLTNPDDPGLKEFEEGIASQKARIRNHPYLPFLTDVHRKRALRGLEMYTTKAEFENTLGVCKDLRRNYRHLSNLAHPQPIAFERIDNERGRGIGSEADVLSCTVSLMLARRFLAASTVDIADHFPDALAARFEASLSSIRPLINAGY